MTQPQVSQSVLDKINHLRQNLPLWSEKYVKIRLKQGGAPAPLKFKHAQLQLHNFIESIRADKQPVRVCVPKARQLGVSTYTTARYLHRATLNRGTSVFILSHLSDSTNYLFDMVKRMYTGLPEPIRPVAGRSNRKELKFSALDSDYALGTAGSEEVGRGTTPLLLHLSECAFYQKTDELITGLMQGVPTVPESEIIIESTANGINNMFYNLCMKGVDTSSVSRYRTFFLPWYWDPEYRETPPAGFQPNDEEKDMMGMYNITLDQIFWRRRKLEDEYNGDLWKFRQEYPTYLSEAFVASGGRLIKPELLEDARKSRTVADSMAPRILGVDGAGSGADRTVLVLRQGKVILWYKVYKDMNPMRLAGIVGKEIERSRVDMAFVDTAYGDGAVSRLHELGFKHCVQGVHFGERALDPELYLNKRAQMYGYLKEWFEEGGARIPADEEFISDLLIIPPLERSGSRGVYKMPPKDVIRTEFGKSPDIGDACGLTFAYPVRSRSRMNFAIVQDPHTARVNSPFKSRRLEVGISNQDRPSELFVDGRV